MNPAEIASLRLLFRIVPNEYLYTARNYGLILMTEEWLWSYALLFHNPGPRAVRCCVEYAHFRESLPWPDVMLGIYLLLKAKAVIPNQSTNIDLSTFLGSLSRDLSEYTRWL